MRQIYVVVCTDSQFEDRVSKQLFSYYKGIIQGDFGFRIPVAVLRNDAIVCVHCNHRLSVVFL